MITANSTDFVKDGLVFYFDPSVASSQWTGSAWGDLSAEGNHAVDDDTTPTTSTEFGGILVMDGVNNLLASTDNVIASTGNPFSVTAWAKLDALDSTNNIAQNYHIQTICQIGSRSASQWGKGINLGKRELDTWAVAKQYGTLVINSGYTVVVGVWDCVTYTFDGSNHKMYVNGILRATTTSAHDTMTDCKLLVSCWSIPTTAMTNYKTNWEGDMGPLLVYDKTLSAEEVLQNFEVSRGRFGV